MSWLNDDDDMMSVFVPVQLIVFSSYHMKEIKISGVHSIFKKHLNNLISGSSGDIIVNLQNMESSDSV